jgi:amino acid transporter
VGVVVTLMLGIYGLVAESNEDLFWMLFAAQGAIFLTPYIGAVIAFIHSRLHDADAVRPYRIPGGMPVAWLVTVLCFSFLCLSVLLFVYVPGEGFDWPVVIGSGTALLIGEIALRYSERHTPENT